jgi:hypothetical protein
MAPDVARAHLRPRRPVESESRWAHNAPSRPQLRAPHAIFTQPGPTCDLSAGPRHVRHRGRSGKDLLALSFTGCDLQALAVGLRENRHPIPRANVSGELTEHAERYINADVSVTRLDKRAANAPRAGAEIDEPRAHQVEGAKDSAADGLRHTLRQLAMAVKGGGRCVIGTIRATTTS